MKALKGMRIIECGQGISAPFAAKLFSDAGATVIKIEPPDGGDLSRAMGPYPNDIPNAERSGMFHYLNAGKKSLTLDLTLTAGQAVLEQLVKHADVLLLNGDIEQLERMGLYPEMFRVNHPALVITTITPFGYANAMSRVRASDLTLCALGAVTSAVGEPGREPLTPPLQLSDYQAGVAAASATLLALFARRQSGKGQHVDISALDVWATVHQGSGFSNYTSFGKTRTRAGRRRHEAYPFHFLAAKDGLMCLIARDGAQWRRFVEMVGVPALLNQERYRDRAAMGMKYPEEVDDLLRPWFAQRTRDEIFALCKSNHVPFAPVRRVDEVLACEQLRSRGFFVSTPARADGISFMVPGFASKMSATPLQIQGPAPLLGEHTIQILSDIGLDVEQIEELRKMGAA